LKAQESPYRSDQPAYGGVASSTAGPAQAPIAAPPLPLKGAGKPGRK
jgi:hypothetical protein